MAIRGPWEEASGIEIFFPQHVVEHDAHSGNHIAAAFAVGDVEPGKVALGVGDADWSRASMARCCRQAPGRCGRNEHNTIGISELRNPKERGRGSRVASKGIWTRQMGVPRSRCSSW